MRINEYCESDLRKKISNYFFKHRALVQPTIQAQLVQERDSYTFPIENERFH